MSHYEKKEITFVFKNCSFQAWNVFHIFYSSQLVLSSVGACIHKAIGLKQHWSKDKTTLHEIKIKARISMCPIAIYNLQLQNQDAREASAYSFCAKQNSKKAPSEEPQRAVTPNCRAIALFSKRRANHNHLQQLHPGANATTLSLPSATWCRAAQVKEWSTSISFQILSGGQGPPLCCQPVRSQEKIIPPVVLSWPHGRGLAPGGLSMEECRHARITTHSFALKLGTILDSW